MGIKAEWSGVIVQSVQLRAHLFKVSILQQSVPACQVLRMQQAQTVGSSACAMHAMRQSSGGISRAEYASSHLLAGNVFSDVQTCAIRV